MRMRKKKNLIPRMERCAAQLIRDPYAHQGHWRELMPGAKELRLELGCGKGRFTCQTDGSRRGQRPRSRTYCSSPLRWCRTPWWSPWNGV